MILPSPCPKPPRPWPNQVPISSKTQLVPRGLGLTLKSRLAFHVLLVRKADQCLLSGARWCLSLIWRHLEAGQVRPLGWWRQAGGLIWWAWPSSEDPAQINTRAIMRHLMTTCLGDMSLKVYTWYFDKVLKVNWDYSLLEIVCCHVLCIPSLLTYIFSSSFHSPPVSFINTIGKFG